MRALSAAVWVSLLVFSAGAQARDPGTGLVNRSERAKVIEDICRSLRENYVFWDLKKARLGLDPEATCAEYQERELAILDPIPPLTDPVIGEANLKYYERLKELEAKFQDTHLGFEPTVEFDAFMLPFNVEKARGGYFVAFVDEPMLKALKIADGALKPGDRLTSIDGSPVEDTVREIARYVSASSPAFAMAHAARILTHRAFPFPRKTSVEVAIERTSTDGKSSSTSTVTLPWLQPEAPSADQLSYVLARKFIDVPKVDRGSAAPKASGPRALNISNIYSSPEGTPVVIAGFFMNGDKIYGYLKINDFIHPSLIRRAPNGAGGTPASFDQAITENLKEFESAGYPLILNLRQNNGGSPALALGVLSRLINSNEKGFLNFVEGMRITNFTMNMARNQGAAAYTEAKQSAGKPDNAPYTNLKYMNDTNELHNLGVGMASIKAARDGKPYSYGFQAPDLTMLPTLENSGSPLAYGFGGPVGVMTSPDCISACDALVLMLKANHRGILVGMPTNGTGGGFTGFGNISSQELQIPGSFVTVRIPVIAFGAGSKSTDKLSILPQLIDELSVENRPTQPDVAYEPMIGDVSGASDGWLKATADAIEKDKR